MEPKKKITTLLLAIFLGVFGAHRFYVGKTGTAILQLVTCGGLFGVWVLVDIVLILTGKFLDKHGNGLVD